LAEATSRLFLSRGMQGLAIRIARRVNAALSRRGRVFYRALPRAPPANAARGASRPGLRTAERTTPSRCRPRLESPALVLRPLQLRPRIRRLASAAWLGPSPSARARSHSATSNLSAHAPMEKARSHRARRGPRRSMGPRTTPPPRLGLSRNPAAAAVKSQLVASVEPKARATHCRSPFLIP
jgi:hypothetical protein